MQIEKNDWIKYYNPRLEKITISEILAIKQEDVYPHDQYFITNEGYIYLKNTQILEIRKAS